MELSSKERNYLRKLAHDIDPIVRIGKNGITDTLLESIKQAINKQELIKVKILQNSKEQTDRQLISKIEQYCNCDAIYDIGHTMIFFKKKIDENNKRGVITEMLYNFRKGK